MILNWFLSKTVRQAVAMRKHVFRILCAQRDILSPQAIGAVNGALDELQKAAGANVSKDALLKQMEQLEKAANKWLKPYPNASWRENVEVLLVALAVAMGIRTFFLQPFKIPTGSMQPTLFGVTSEDLSDRPDFKMPAGWARIGQWFEGVSCVEVKAKTDGELEAVEKPFSLLIFNIKQTVWIGGVAHTIWFPPDYGAPPNGTLEARANLHRGQSFTNGGLVVRLKAQSGDHLFVDRLTYNFRRPKRGEIIVFETKGIPEERRNNPPYWYIPPDQFYIKRLVALGGEQVRIGDDRHLVINGQRLDASTPHFENVYSFNPKEPPRENHYSGHVNFPALVPYFREQPNGTVTVSPNHYLVMGDNTMNSLDSRSWGEFPASSVIGKSFFVYWPITKRFGWGQQ
jgi:signal peptidase I